MTAPDGLIFDMYGPEVGRRHEITLYRQSGMEKMFIDAMCINNPQFYFYGDSAYILRPWLQVEFDSTWANIEQLAFKSAMCSVREAIGMSYKDMKQMWTSQDYKRMLKVRQAFASLMYKAASCSGTSRSACSTNGKLEDTLAVLHPLFIDMSSL